MDNKLDTIQGMKTFAAVATAGSFTVAADRMGTTTKLTSKYVKQLEQRLGVQLLNRTTRSLSLTEIGHVYLRKCQLLIEDFDELEAAMQDQQGEPRGNIRISAPRTFGDLFLTSSVAEFLSSFPGISVDLRLSDRFVNIVDEGFDLAIRAGSMADSSLVARKLATGELVLCASPEYFDKHPAPLKPSDLKDHSCILDSNLRNGMSWPFLDEQGVIKNYLVTGRFMVNSASSAREAALNHLGLIFCPRFFLEKDLKSGFLRPALERHNKTSMDLFALYPGNRHLTTKVRVFVDFLVEHFSSGIH